MSSQPLTVDDTAFLQELFTRWNAITPTGSRKGWNEFRDAVTGNGELVHYGHVSEVSRVREILARCGPAKPPGVGGK